MLSLPIYSLKSKSGRRLFLILRPCIKNISHIPTNSARTLSAPVVAVFLMILRNSKLFPSLTTLYVICAFLKTSISHLISHAASIFSIKIAFSSISLGSHKINVFIYVGHVIISSPKIISPPKRLRISAGSDLFLRNFETWKTFSIPTKEPEKAHTPAQRQNHPVLDPARGRKGPFRHSCTKLPQKTRQQSDPSLPTAEVKIFSRSTTPAPERRNGPQRLCEEEKMGKNPSAMTIRQLHRLLPPTRN